MKCSRCPGERRPGQRYCRDCYKAYMAKYRAENRDRIKATHNRWLAKEELLGLEFVREIPGPDMRSKSNGQEGT
jgi:hypothetical protein